MFEGELEYLVAPRSLLLHVSRTFSSVLYGFYRGDWNVWSHHVPMFFAKRVMIFEYF